MERPKGVIGQWYTLTSEAKGDDDITYSNGFAWPCNEVDYEGDPLLPCGYALGRHETYRLATPEEISKAIAKAKGELTPYQEEDKGKPTKLLNFEKPDNVNPEHYKQLPKETIDAMVFIWGKDAVAKHCQMSAFKYRMRLGHKEGQALEDEVGKIKWYEDKARELRG
jgi:hypothetical protein